MHCTSLSLYQPILRIVCHKYLKMGKVQGLLRSLFNFILLINFQHLQGDCYRQCFYISKHNQNTNQPPRWLRKHKQVVKVIWHNAASPLQTGSSIVFARLRQLALPGEYDWTCASFGPPESTNHNPNGNLIGSAQLTAECRRAYPFL